MTLPEFMYVSTLKTPTVERPIGVFLSAEDARVNGREYIRGRLGARVVVEKFTIGTNEFEFVLNVLPYDTKVQP